MLAACLAGETHCGGSTWPADGLGVSERICGKFKHQHATRALPSTMDRPCRPLRGMVVTCWGLVMSIVVEMVKNLGPLEEITAGGDGIHFCEMYITMVVVVVVV